MCFYRDQHKGEMNVFKIYGMVVWQFMHDVFGDFELVIECVLF